MSIATEFQSAVEDAPICIACGVPIPPDTNEGEDGYCEKHAKKVCCLCGDELRPWRVEMGFSHCGPCNFEDESDDWDDDSVEEE